MCGEIIFGTACSHQLVIDEKTLSSNVHLSGFPGSFLFLILRSTSTLCVCEDSGASIFQPFRASLTLAHRRMSNPSPTLFSHVGYKKEYLEVTVKNF